MSSKTLRHIVTLGALLLVACGYDSHIPPSSSLLHEEPNANVEALRYYAEEGVEVTESINIGGTVTANDASGNFYRTIVVEDTTAAVEVSMGLWDLAALYPVGSEIVVSTRGLVVGYYDGALTLGRKSYDWSGGRVEPIAPRDEIFERVRATGKGFVPTPATHTIGSLTQEMCGRLVRIEGLTYVGEEPSWGTTEYGSEVERLFVDSEGMNIMVRTSRYADFADHNIPTNALNITGILYRTRLHGEDIFALKIRDLGDVER